MKTALVIIDMQNFFSRIVDKPLANIKTLHEFFEQTSEPIIFTQHGHTEDELVPPIKNQLIRLVGADNVIMVNTPDWELIPDIWKMAKDAPVIAKNTYDAFMATDLEACLRQQNVERLIITGVMTDVCCQTTAVSGFVRGYKTWLISDACWTDYLVQHVRAVKALGPLIGRVYTTAEAVDRLLDESSNAPSCTAQHDSPA